ncbi:MAG: ornithine carbamoyltransferase [Gloeomargarita sp. SKYBB_i_bin120]|nr:ornithine carbamoyltransferase [Gloeomargarita sp. SKYG98]MCS7291486.1 ornithine carbamoyltransferase [Gloeomargarita sp. SKYB120]MDW8177046.1 ornithine carbamoyltransferase [Gloeomargarita sp. SKYBB_i_bin120]
MNTLAGRDILSMADFSAAEIHSLLELARLCKQGHAVGNAQGRVLGLLFTKASTRTRVSFTVAMMRLGGQVIDLNPGAIQMGRGEPIADTARVLDRYLDVLAIRTFAQADVVAFAEWATMPVINALTDLEHPCQVLADLLTIQECFGALAGLKMAYLGDGNNVCHSLLLGCALMGIHLTVATPPEHGPDRAIWQQAQQLAGDGTRLVHTHDPEAAVRQAQVIYTDVWASMGQEAENAVRLPRFLPYQVNERLLALADPNAIVLHCLPAHRGEEITEAVLEGTQSRVWDQAENRLHAQQALLAQVLGLV